METIQPIGIRQYYLRKIDQPNTGENRGETRVRAISACARQADVLGAERPKTPNNPKSQKGMNPMPIA